MISLPNGVKARDASLKCCMAKGIPIIVIPRIIPKIRWVRLIQIPPQMIQRILNKVLRQPLLYDACRVVRPNGQSARMASFKVWIPKGIPIIVTIRIILATKYSTAIINPPNINQMRFPRSFIIAK